MAKCTANVMEKCTGSVMQEPVLSLDGNDVLEREALLDWFHFVQAESTRESALGGMGKPMSDRQTNLSCLQAEQEETELSKLLQPQCFDCDEANLLSRSAESIEESKATIEEAEEEESKRSSMPAKSSAGISQGNFATLQKSSGQLQYIHRHSAHVEDKKEAADSFVVKEKAAQQVDICSTGTQFQAFPSIYQRLIRPCFSCTPATFGINQPSPLEHVCMAQAVNAVAAMGGCNEQAEASHAEDNQEVTGEECSSGSKQLISSFQHIQSRLTRPISLTPHTTFHQSPSISRSILPFSECQDCLKLTATPVRPIVRGDVCRRMLFSKRTDADDVAISSHINGAQKRGRIEDYVDPFLLSEATQKVRLSHSKQLGAARKSFKYSTQVNSDVAEDARNGFKWPSADLLAMVLSGPADCQGRQ
ncbi:hypothetical protein L7F22_068367 [Adiantum nelumboides]|nr:hypothetical protein [Adiantum nelumboides]